jgi:hypothetical protein
MLLLTHGTPPGEAAGAGGDPASTEAAASGDLWAVLESWDGAGASTMGQGSGA